MEYANAIVDVIKSDYTTMLQCYTWVDWSFIHLSCSRRYM